MIARTARERGILTIAVVTKPFHFEAHLADAGGSTGERYRTSALERFDEMAKAGILTERESALRRKLWGG